MTESAELVEVKLLRLPLDLYQEASEHQDELQREFSLIQHDSSLEGSNVPRRLLQLVDQLNARFGAFSDQPTTELSAALEQGAACVDLKYQVPPQARGAAIELGALLDEADEFCRRGDHLLTLATPPAALSFRRWFLDQFVAQIDGADPTPWDAWNPEASGS